MTIMYLVLYDLFIFNIGSKEKKKIKLGVCLESVIH